MKAVILGGGEGARLRPISCDAPKPMTELVGKPLIQYSIELLRRAGISSIAVTLGYMAEDMARQLGDGGDMGVCLRHFRETHPLGTAGSVKNAETFLDETFVVMRGDGLTDVDIREAIRLHRQNRWMATAVLKRLPERSAHGIALADGDGRIRALAEKPEPGGIFSDLANTGIYVVEPALLRLIPRDRPCDFSKELFPKMLAAGMELGSYITEAYWNDVSDPSALLRAAGDILAGRVAVEKAGVERDGIWLGAGVQISPSSVVEAPCYIGDGAVIGDGARIGAYASIEAGSQVREGAVVKRAILGRNTCIGRNAKVSGAVICRGSAISSGARVLEGAVLGAETVVERNAAVCPGVRIWPGKWIESGITVRQNIVWGYGRRRRLFGIHGIFGEYGRDADMGDIARMGAVLAGVLQTRAFIGHDGSDAACVIAEALALGMGSAGEEADICGRCFLPELVCRAGDALAIHISMTGGDAFNGAVLRGGAILPAALWARLNDALDRGDMPAGGAGKIARTRRSGGLFGAYAQTLPKTSHGAVGVFGRTPADGFLAKALESAGIRVLREVQEVEPAFCALSDRNANRGRLYSGKVKLVGDQLELATYAIALACEQPRLLHIPPEAPRGVWELAGAAGTSPKAGRGYDRVVARYFEDFPFLCARLLALLVRRNQSFAEFVEGLPSCCSSYRTVRCKWSDVGRIMRRLAGEMDDAGIAAGIEHQEERGSSRIFPGEAFPSICIRTEGMDQETAEELCDFHAALVRKILNEE